MPSASQRLLQKGRMMSRTYPVFELLAILTPCVLGLLWLLGCFSRPMPEPPDAGVDTPFCALDKHLVMSVEEKRLLCEPKAVDIGAPVVWLPMNAHPPKFDGPVWVVQGMGWHIADVGDGGLCVEGLSPCQGVAP